jgi:hypothetical protein
LHARMSWSYLAAFWKSIASDSRLPTNLPTRTSDLPPMIYRAAADEDIVLLARRQTFKRRHAVRNEMERLTFCREDRLLRAAIY